MLSDDAVVSRLKRAIFSALGVSPADYRLDVALDVGDTFVTVQDVRGGVDTFGNGEPVWAGGLGLVYDAQVLDAAERAAEKIRPHLLVGPDEQ
jgi:hypothetical protein